MRWLFAFIALLAICTSADPQFAIFQVNGGGAPSGFGGGQYLQQYNVFGCSPTALQPSNYYQSGAGCPAVSTADALYINGVYGARPYDLLDTACGSVGASVAATKGRYAWVFSPDHDSGPTWNDGVDIYIGFSNDPGILPQAVTPIVHFNSTVNRPTASFTGSITSNVLTANATVSGRIAYNGNQTVTGTGISTTITAPLSGNATVGKDGTYTATNANAGSTTVTQTQTNVQPNYFPVFVCNPDSTSEAFLVYMQVSDGGGNDFEDGVVYAADPSAGWTFYGPTHISPNGTFTYDQRVVRTGTSTWKSLGLTNWPTNNTVAYQQWTSSDPLTGWDTNGTQINSCLPIPGGAPNFNGCPNSSSLFVYASQPPQGITTTVSAQNYILSREDSNLLSGSNQGQYLSLVPVDAGYNVTASPSVIRLSNKYNGIYPGPTFVQSGTGGYQEDGILFAFAQVGMFECLNIPACSTIPSPPYNPGNPLSGGGLWQQKIDRYCYITDSTAALNAAPSGVTASAAAGVVTLSWDNCRPNQNYRIYWGTSPNSFPNVVSPDVTGLSTTITPYLQVPQTVYFKVVSLSSGVEEKSRVVSTYVSSSTKFVNQHVGRCLALGGDPATIDRAWLDSVDALATTQGLQNNIQTWEDASFGVKQDGSGIVSVACDLGTTRLPRGGDLTFCTGASPCSGASGSTYSPTAFGSPGTTPGINNGTTDFGYFGAGRTNNIRRKVNFSLCAFYQKNSTGTATVASLGANDIGPNMFLQHTSGGNAVFGLADDQNVAAITVSQSITGHTSPHVICGTFDTTGATSPTNFGTLKVYADGTVTSGPDTTHVHANIDLSLNTALKGFVDGGRTSPGFGFGSDGIKTLVANDGAGPASAPAYTYETNQSNFINGAIMAFDVALTQAQVTAITNAYLNRVNPNLVAVKTYNIVTNFMATCNGTADDNSAFTAFTAAALTFQSMTPGLIELDIPQGDTCLFSGTSSGNRFTAGIKQLRVVGLGSGATLTDNLATLAASSATSGSITFSSLPAGTANGLTVIDLTTPSAIPFGTTISSFNSSTHVIMTSATITVAMGDQIAIIGNGIFLGDGNNDQSGDNTKSDRLATVTKGSTSVTLQETGACAPSCAALFNVGDWALVTGYDRQGGGQPTSPAFADYIKITGISGQVISFTGTPLTHDYKSTWPLYSAGNAFNPDQGGPATIYALNQDWNTVQEYNNLTIVQNGNVFAKGRDITFKGVTISSSESIACADPSVSMNWRFIGGSMSGCHIEVDKIIDYALFQNIAVNTIDFQSADPKLAVMSEVNAATAISGSAINTIIANSSVASWQPGAHSFGASYGQTYLLGNFISAFQYAGASSAAAVSPVGTWSGGTWTIADSSIPSVSGGNPALNFIVPGANIYWGAGTFGTAGPILQVADVSHSGSNTIVSFNQGGSAYAGGFPTIPNASTATAKVHPVPQYFGSGNTGVLDTVSLNPPAQYQGLPLGSYYSDVITHANGNPASPNTPYVFGQMTEADWTITAACGAASTFEFVPTNSIQTLGSSSTSGTWSPTANATVTSPTPRQMFPTATAGGQSGDSLTAPGANTWLNNGQDEPAYGTIANCGSASTTVTITTNQGVVNPAQF